MSQDSKSPSFKPRTKAVRAGINRTAFSETSEALFLNSGYVYDSAQAAADAFAGEKEHFIYSRYGNPSLKMLEERLAAIEGAEACRVCATGMSAIFSAMACQLKAGDRVVASRALFGACFAIIDKILPKWGVETILVDGRSLAAWEEALQQPTQLVFLESPSNPMLEIIDIEAVSKLAHQAGARLVVDNVFATPIYQSPLALGADIVTYSTTKHIDGQGRMLGGAVLGSTDFIEEIFLPFYRQTGAAMSPFNAWVMLKSLETLHIRVDAQTQTSRLLADRLAQDKRVKNLLYPGHPSHPQYALAQKQMSAGSSLMIIEFEGGRNAAFAFLDALQLIDISNNLGDSKSLACHPASTTHANLSQAERDMLAIGQGCVRLSVGLEDPHDLWADIDHALAQIGG